MKTNHPWRRLRVFFAAVLLAMVLTPPSGWATAPYFTDNMEGVSQWTAASPWALTTASSHSASHAWTDSPAGAGYGNNADLSLTLASPIDLSAAVKPQLAFWHRYLLEAGFDFGYLEISQDGGTSWLPVPLGAYTGTSDWKREQIDLAAFAGQAGVKIRFRLVSDKDVVWDGWTIDDVSIAEPPEAVADLSVGTPLATSLTLNWAQSFDADFASYRIYRSTTAGVTTNSTLVATITNRATLTLIDTNLLPNTTYYYRVYVFNSLDLAAGSREESGKTAIAQFAYPFTDSFEGAVGGWTAGSPWAIVQLDAADSHTGAPSKVWTDSPAGSYAPSADALLQLSIDLGSAVMPVLSFWQRYSFETSDYGFVEVRETGTTAWRRIYGATGTAAWYEEKIDLSEYAGKRLDLRFRVKADAGVVSDGWTIDDVRIGETLTAPLSYPLNDPLEADGNWLTSSWAPVANGHSGIQAMTDSPAGNYTPETHSELVLASTIDMRSSIHPQLSFWHKYEIVRCDRYCGTNNDYYASEYDYGRVYVSTNKGQPGTWTQVASFNGSQGTWKKEQLDLSAYHGQQNIRIKFVMSDYLSSNGTGVQTVGWTVDDVVIEEIPQEVVLSITASAMNSVSLAWTANADADFNRYEIFRSSAPGVTRTGSPVATIAGQGTLAYTDAVAMVQPGVYYYRIWAIDNDGNVSLPSNEVQATYTIPVNAYPFSDNAESGTAKWSFGSPWGLTAAEQHSGASAWSDSPGSNYGANANTSMATFVDMRGSTTPVLTFWHKYALEEAKDFVHLEVSTDNGQTWTALRSFTGVETAWNLERVNMTAYAGHAGLGLRFRLTSDAANSLDGWLMADLMIQEEVTQAPYPFTDDMEGGIAPWFYDSPWGIVELTAAESRSGAATRAWADSPAGAYAANADASLQLSIDLTAAVMPVLSFWHKYAFDPNSDFGFVEVRRGGSNTWSRIYFITGTASAWSQARIDLAEYAGNLLNIRFRVKADANGTNAGGWVIDDLRIGETQTPAITYPLIDGMESDANWLTSSWAPAAEAYNGTGAFTDSITGSYGPETSASLILANTIDLSGAAHPQLTFWHKYETVKCDRYCGTNNDYYASEYDYGRVYLSTNRGQPGTWTQLAAYSGSQAAWMREQIDLTAWAGQSDIRIKFVMNDNLSTNGTGEQLAGWTIDEVAMENAPADVTLAVGASSMNSVTLTWTTNADADFSRYEVYRSNTPGVNRSSALVASLPLQSTGTHTDPVALVQPGVYYYRVWVYDRDGNVSMGSNEVQATYAVPVNAYPFAENGEAGTLKWTWGSPWGLTDAESHGGTWAWTDSPGAIYSANANTSLSTFLNLTGSTTPVLTFWHKYSLEEGKDFLRLEVSIDNGQTWTILKSFTGTETAWNLERVNLTAYAGHARLGLRFRLVSDGATQMDGWTVDDLHVREESILAVYPFADDMEGDVSPWFYDSPWGIVELSDTESHSGVASRVWSDSPGGAYASGADASLWLAIDMGSAVMPVLSFWHRYAFDPNSDYGYIEIREGGSNTWKRLYGITGTSPGWIESQVSLSDYAGKVVEIRFRVKADTNGTTSSGWLIDDVRIGETQAPPLPYPLTEDFEGATTANWIFSSWERGGGDLVHAGVYGVTDSPLGSYYPEVNAELAMANVISLRGAVHPLLTFWHKYDTVKCDRYCGTNNDYYASEYDYGRVYLSTNKGQPGTWVLLTSFSGAQSTWTKAQLNLSAWAGLPDIRLKFVMNDNLSTNGTGVRAGGWTIDDVRIGEDETIPTYIQKVSGDAQVGQIGQGLAAPFAVTVFDAQSRPRSGITVNFAVTAGGGALSAAGGVSDAQGRVSTLLTLGAASGINTVTATVADSTESVTFTATGYAVGQAMTLAKVSGDNQYGAVGTALDNLLVVRVTDILGNPVAETAVTFSRTSGNGNLAVAAPVLTDADGLAMNGLTLGATTGLTVIAATASGLLGSPLSFTAQAVLAGGSPGDVDGDGMPDSWETANNLNPLDPADAALDADGDTLTNLTEYTRGTNPNSADTDGDMMPDAWEIRFGLNPLFAGDALLDANSNGKSNLQEYLDGTVPVTERHFPAAAVTDRSMAVYGTLTIDGLPAMAGDEVAAICPGNIVCGRYTVGTTGQYGFMNVYGDDPATPAVEGAQPGDPLTFRIWDVSTGLERDGQATVVGGGSPVWGSDRQIVQINLSATDAQIIPLQAGWNLISFGIKNCYYMGNSPTVPMMDGIQYVPVASIADIFGAIAGKVEVVRSFDSQGPHTYVPGLEYANDLTYMAAGYGYWIKMSEPGDLILEGRRALPADSLELHTGWNLVGYWGSDVRYVGSQPPVAFPEGTVFTPVSGLAESFAAITGNYGILWSFDAEGAHIFDPALPASVNTMTYLGPGYGFWLRMKTPDDLWY